MATPGPVALALPAPAGCSPTIAARSYAWRGQPSPFLHGLSEHPARWLLLGIAAVTALSSAATVASPYLATRAPLVLMCLSPRMAFLGIAARDASLPTFLVLGTIRLALTDPAHYLLGRRLGPFAGPGPPMPPRLRELRRRLDRVAARVPRPIRFAARPACVFAVLVRPNGVNLLWAGRQGLSVPLVAVLDLVGTLGYLLTVHAGTTALTGG